MNEEKIPFTKKLFYELIDIAQTNPVEICGFLKLDDNKLIIDKESLNPGKTFPRNHCYHLTKSYPRFVFHTHPLTSKPFPSLEDIEHVSKHPGTIQLVVTNFGIWVLRNKFDISNFILHSYQSNKNIYDLYLINSSEFRKKYNRFYNEITQYISDQELTNKNCVTMKQKFNINEILEMAQYFKDTELDIQIIY